MTSMRLLEGLGGASSALPTPLPMNGALLSWEGLLFFLGLFSPILQYRLRILQFEVTTCRDMYLLDIFSLWLLPKVAPFPPF